MLLIQGGALDPHVQLICAAAHARRLAHVPTLISAEHIPQFRWDLARDTLMLDGATIAPTAAFIRYNVFMRSAHAADATGGSDSFRAQAWYAAFDGWIAAHSHVRCFNRGHRGAASKPYQLVRARRAGLQIPDTVIANALTDAECAHGDALIAKPVAGGGYAHTLADALAPFPAGTRTLPAPALIQNRLVPPETRVFIVGDRCFAFDVAADALDYREATDTVVTAVQTPALVVAPLLTLAADMGLDFAAADFKTDPATGAPVFLEINAQPMFARFDAASNGALVTAMLDWLSA